MSLHRKILSTASAAAASRRASRLRTENDERTERQPAVRRGPIERPAAPRRRVRDETREQMIERLTNPQISLYEASVILGVCAATVRRYTDSGELPHARTEGRQRRFYLRDVMALLRERETHRR